MITRLIPFLCVFGIGVALGRISIEWIDLEILGVILFSLGVLTAIAPTMLGATISKLGQGIPDGLGSHLRRQTLDAIERRREVFWFRFILSYAFNLGTAICGGLLRAESSTLNANWVAAVGIGAAVTAILLVILAVVEFRAINDAFNDLREKLNNLRVRNELFSGRN